MRFSTQHIRATIRACIFELLENGYDLLHADATGLSRLVCEHLDYLQLMLGYDASVDELIRLITFERRSLGAACLPAEDADTAGLDGVNALLGVTDDAPTR